MASGSDLRSEDAALTWEGEREKEGTVAMEGEGEKENVISQGIRQTQAVESGERRRQASSWIQELTGESIPICSDERFCCALKNGEVLCRLLNAFTPNVVTKVFEGSEVMPATYNIDSFFEGARRVGLSKDDLFHAADLDRSASEGASGHPVVNCVLRLKALWNDTKSDCISDKGEEERTPSIQRRSSFEGFRTPPMPPADVPLGKPSAIKTAKGRGLAAAVSVTRLMQQCTSLLKDRMWSDSPTVSVSPLSACSTSPERTVEALGPVIESVLSSLTQEYERRLLQKESDLKKAKNELFHSQMKMQSLEKSCLEEKEKENAKSVAIESERANRLAEDLNILKKKQGETHQHAMSLKSQAKDLKDMCQSIKLDAMLEISDFQIELSQIEHHLGHLFGIANDYTSLCDENKRLYNEVLDLKGNIRVYTRVRPAGTTGSKETAIVNVDHSSDLKDKVSLDTGSATAFAFEKAFDENASQEKVYEEVAAFIRPVLDGYNVCLFAYGQTGSGKTYTMTGGDGHERGVNIRAIEDLFQIIQRNSHESEYSVSIQMLEIYNEQLRDLLDENQEKKLEIRSLEKSGINVPGVITQKVSSVSEVLEFMDFGQKNRAVGATAMNERSSRSHSVFTIRVSSVSRLNSHETNACLHLIDLAGSERVSRSEATGERLKEAQHINKSLSALGDVIAALASKQNHIPYRNSKLTHLLADSLNGSAKVLMLSHIAPEKDNCSETISTLHFATRVSSVTLGKAKKNLVQNSRKHEEELTKKDQEIQKLRSLLAQERKAAKETTRRLSTELENKTRPISASARRPSAENKRVTENRRLSSENVKKVRPASAVPARQPREDQKPHRRPLSAANFAGTRKKTSPLSEKARRVSSEKNPAKARWM